MVKTRLERHIFLCMFNIKYEKFLKVKRTSSCVILSQSSRDLSSFVYGCEYSRVASRCWNSPRLTAAISTLVSVASFLSYKL